MQLVSAARAVLALVTLMLVGAPVNAHESEAASVRQSFELHVSPPPAIVQIGSDRWLRHELHLTSFARETLTLTSVEVMDDDSGRVLGRLAGAALEAALYIPGVAAAAAEKRTITAGRRAIVYVDVRIDGTVPVALRHRVEFEASEGSGVAHAFLSGARTRVEARPLPVLGPPLRGGPWVAVYDPDLERGHRRVVYAVGGRATIPGRYAIDWMRPGGGAAAQGAGAEVLAVADGTVSSIRDGVAEPAPGMPRPRTSLADATGNYVSISIGRGRYAFYEHLMPGLLVRPGQRVRRGQVIGRLGSTGQASRPHLHFHVADADSPLAAEGVPFVLKGARVVGYYPSISAFEAGGGWIATSERQEGPTMPRPNAVIHFP